MSVQTWRMSVQTWRMSVQTLRMSVQTDLDLPNLKFRNFTPKRDLKNKITDLIIRARFFLGGN